MKEKSTLLTKKDFRTYEKQGILTLYPLCLNCAFRSIIEFQEKYPEASITLQGSELGGYLVTFLSVHDLLAEENNEESLHEKTSR